MKWFPRVGTLDDVIDWPPHPSPRLCWWHVCSLQLRHQTSHLYDDTCDDVIKGHSHGVAHLIQWPLLLPTAIDVLYAERRSMATFLSPITTRRCVFCGSQGIAKGNYCGSQWVKENHQSKLIMVMVYVDFIFGSLILFLEDGTKFFCLLRGTVSNFMCILICLYLQVISLSYNFM